MLFTPRELWHDCGHDHDSHSSHEVKIDKDDCFACDYGLGFIESKGELGFYFTKEKISTLILFSESFLPADTFDQFSHRGPPSA